MTISTAIRDAVRLVRANPGAVDAVDAEERAAAAAREAEAKRISGLEAKLAKALPERVDQLVADYVALEQEALHRAAEKLAREQLARSSGWSRRGRLRWSPRPSGSARFTSRAR